MPKNIIVSWNDIIDYLNNFLLEANLPSKITGIYGIPRGGLIFAVILSHMLDVPLLQAPCKDCIVIDDIADTGKTLLHYKEAGYFVTTMFYHKQSLVVPDFWYKEKTDCWVVYPWEVN